jgi:hypothetical protein
MKLGDSIKSAYYMIPVWSDFYNETSQNIDTHIWGRINKEFFDVWS